MTIQKVVTLRDGKTSVQGKKMKGGIEGKARELVRGAKSISSLTLVGVVHIER